MNIMDQLSYRLPAALRCDFCPNVEVDTRDKKTSPLISRDALYFADISLPHLFAYGKEND